jgi:hypothetical protein
MANNVSNFIIDKTLRYDHDVTWSFQYSLNGNSNTDGGFTTFLLNSQTDTTGGGIGPALGVAAYQSYLAKQSVVLCVAIDSSGIFGTNSIFSTGRSTAIPNSMTIRVGNNFTYLTSFPLSLFELDGLINTEKFNTLRFNLTNVGRTLNISKLNKYNEYDLIYSYTGSFGIRDDKAIKIGFSQSSPILIQKFKSVLKLKDIHVQGMPLNDFYILQSPNEDHILLSDKNVAVGSLLRD